MLLKFQGSISQDEMAESVKSIMQDKLKDIGKKLTAQSYEAYQLVLSSHVQ